MNRLLGFLTCVIVGVALVFCGLLMPAHLRVVDASIIAKAGGNHATVIDRGLGLVHENNLGAAQMLGTFAQNQKLPGLDKLSDALMHAFAASFEKNNGHIILWGGGAMPDLAGLFTASLESVPLDAAHSKAQPFTEFVVVRENRTRLLSLLQASSIPVVQELLRTRGLTNTALLPPSASASGQAFDTAIAICGLLAEQGKLTPEFVKSMDALAHEANRGANSQRMEQMLLDMMSFGQRLNWNQLAVFAAQLKDTETLRLLANLARQSETRLPEIYALTVVSGKPEAVAAYLMKFSQTGMDDLVASLRTGAGSVDELLKRDERLHRTPWRDKLAASAPFAGIIDLATYYSWRTPQIALMVRWILILAGGCFLAASLHAARPAVSALERPLQVRGFHVAREVLFGLGFLFVVLLLSEPFLSQDSQKMALPFRLRLPTVETAAQAGAAIKATFMNEKNILALLLFFVLQALLYVACLVKLAEIRRQKVPARVKLKLLENEDHLFDAGLYLGFACTIISLILSMGVMKLGLMAAYSSTSFGVVFVSIFKIFHLRPMRRKLLMESEAASPEGARRVEPAGVIQSA